MSNTKQALRRQHLGYSRGVIRELSSEGWRVELDLSRQVLALDVPEREYGCPPELRGVTLQLAGGQWTAGGRRIDLKELYARPHEEPVAPSFEWNERDRFVSVALIGAKTKAFDDGLLAAVELVLQRGAGDFRGKAWLVRAVAEALSAVPGAGEAAALLRAACALGEGGDTGRDAPPVLGFYGWNAELAAIYRQDRTLQRRLESAEAREALARVLHDTPELRSAYERWLGLVERLTNPFAAREGRFLPTSTSPEAELGRRLLGEGVPVPPGFQLVDALIAAIESGKLSLEPGPGSGWYDHQAFALAAIVALERTPEGARLRIRSGYRKHLRELFRSLLALTRETHVKQVDEPNFGLGLPPAIVVEPELTVEPLAEHYARKAASYRFVRGVLESFFDPRALASLRRETAGGAVELPLVDELSEVETLCRGAGAIARQELGLETDAADGTAVLRFREWASRLTTDADLSADVRCMVPLYRDVGRSKLKVLAVLGWSSKPLHVSFARTPRVARIAGGTAALEKASWLKRWTGAQPRVRFVDTRKSLVQLVSVELLVDRPLSRDEHRRICDRHTRPSEIVAELQRA